MYSSVVYFTLLLWLPALAMSVVYGQVKKLEPKEVPQSVVNGFHHHCPNTAAQTWTLHKKQYTVVFKGNGQTGKANFTPEGTWLGSEQNLASNQMPKPALAYLKKKFGSYRVREMLKLQLPDGSSHYRVRLEHRERDEWVTADFDLEGKLKAVDMPRKKH
jgi:hypothetical protein